jgi:hypothetical protein
VGQEQAVGAGVARKHWGLTTVVGEANTFFPTWTARNTHGIMRIPILSVSPSTEHAM